jgi:hypothetical protein
MTRALSNPRYERKFVVREMPAAAVRSTILRHPALFREAYPPRAVNNVYLDTPSLSDYADHVRGAAARSKTRVRWYGGAGGDARPVLERKLRRGELGGKESFPLPPWCIDGGDAWPDLADALSRAALPAAVRESVLIRAPVLLNRYDRHYLASADGRIRLTVDSDLRFTWAAPLVPSALSWAPTLPGVVVELKYDPAHAEEAEAVGQALPFRLGRFSKYVIGIERARG